MTVLRELVARLGFEVDKSGFTAAERGVSAIKGLLRRTADAARAAQQETSAASRKAAAAQRATDKAGSSSASMLRTLGEFAAGVGLTSVLHQMVEMASSAQETDSLLGQVFGPAGAQRVRDWSSTVGQEVGRSKFALQQFAGTLGAVIDPMVQNKEKAYEMATSLSTLAVDLASFFNATDQDAMMALRSGLTGEYESLKRFGVVINDATLGEYARSKGITKKVTAMKNAEKTELRYGYIMQATKNAQGDAARTANGFANASRALKDSLRDLGTMMGQSVLPYIEKAIFVARDLLAGFKKLAEGSYILEVAMAVLAATAAVLAFNMVSAFILPAAAVLGLIWLMDQLRAMFTGGRSDIGDWLDEWKGVGTTDELVRSLKDSWGSLIETFENLPDLRGSWDLFAGAIYDVGFAIEYVGEKLKDFLKNPMWEGLKLGASMIGIDAKSVGVEGGLLSEKGALKGSGLLDLFGIESHKAEPRELSFGEQLEKRHHDRFVEIQQRMEAERAAREARRQRRVADRAQAAEDAIQSRDMTEDAGLGISTDPNYRSLFGRHEVRAPAAPAPAAAAAAAAGANMSVYNGPMTNTININGGDTARVKKVVEDVLESRDKAAMSSMPNVAWSE